MAHCRRYIPNQHVDLEQIQQEAQHRWLRPTEICELLRNYQKFQLRSDPPIKPPAGSLFLFDRKVLRYFRKDGHQWRKKKDGKTVKEAHEKLKAGSVDVLHCYYAHGEDNANFQRRSYWMLDEQLENIVLVHYREVKEGYKSGTLSLLNTNSESQHRCHQSIPRSLEQTHSPDTTFQTSYASGPNSVDWPEQTVSSGMENGDSGEGLGVSSLLHPLDGSLLLDTCLHPSGTNGLLELPRYHFDLGVAGASCNNGSTSSTWAEFNGSSRNTKTLHEPQFYIDHQLTRDDLDARVDTGRTAQKILSFGDDGLTDDSRNRVQVHSHSQAASFSIAKSENCKQVDILRNEEVGELKKLDSFGRWMDKEIGRDCDDSLMASNSGNYWNALNTENDDKEVSSLSHHMQLDTDSVGPSLSQEQLFTICDFAPDWAYSGVQTKVLITGTFLGDKNLTNSFKWCCMFGEIEVSAEVVANNAIRCQVPFHVPGRVPFYITCGNRLACSELREFEYLERPSEVAHRSVHEDDVSLQIRLTKLLSSGREKRSDCSVDCKICGLKTLIWSLKNGYESNWKRIEEEVCKGNSLDLLVQELLKDKLYEWIICKTHEDGKGMHALDDKGLCVIHLAAALGYEWAIGPIVASGLSPNFRDARGRTALHWASFYGREETVIALLKLGAYPGAVDDPTVVNPGGQTAADLASSRGHKGIAGYLAEADLTSHLSVLSVNENVMNNVAATDSAQVAFETSVQSVLPTNRTGDEDHSLRGSLAAFMKSAHAAALIQGAFRARSFRQRQLTVSNNEAREDSFDLVALGALNKGQKSSHFQDYLHSAAMKIQHKYRGWTGRNQFKTIRNHVVKIQAHVRGHQVRKQYKKVVWSVGIVEKAILRWRRKSRGLRGFRTETTIGSVAPEVDKSDDYDFLRIGRKQKVLGIEKALARVQSMVRNAEARDQYMRLVSKSEKLNKEDSSKLGELRPSEDKQG